METSTKKYVRNIFYDTCSDFCKYMIIRVNPLEELQCQLGEA